MTLTRLSGVLSLALCAAAPARAEGLPAGVDPEEWAQFQETLDRYKDRMGDFQEEARSIVDAAEAEERQRIDASYGAQTRQLEDTENALRRVAMSRLEAFLSKYPNTTHTPDMMFRLADLYFEESELQFFSADEEYARIEAQAVNQPEMVLPPPPLKDYSRSIELYRQIIERHPAYENLADAYYMLAWCYAATNAEQYDPLAARDVNVQIAQKWPGSDFANDANMRLGEFWFDEPGAPGNPVSNVPVAMSYYNAVLADGPTGRNYDEAIYKLGWSFFKLNEYDRALAYLVQLLDYSDQQFLETGKVSNMRREAVEYLAISYADMGDAQGKSPLQVATAHLDRIGEKKWEHDVVERLAAILEVQTKYDEAIAVLDFLQQRWPNDPKNPEYQHQIAVIYGNKYIPLPDPDRAAKAMAVLTDRYSEGSTWYVANRANPDAIAKARGYIETSLASVAVEYLVRARETGSIADYQLAAAKLQEFLTTLPFGADYDLYEWYHALALFESNQFADAERAYAQILKNDRSPYRDGARFQVMKCREQVALARYGKLDIVAPGAAVQRTVTSQWGKEITVFAISDEQNSFIAAADDLVTREFREAEWQEQLETNRAALLYIPAQIYYLHGQYDEARARFERLIAAYPQTDEAVYASSLYVNTYTFEGNLAAVQAATTRFGNMALGKDPELAALKRQEFDDLRQQAAFGLAYELIQKGDRLGAAAAFVQFMKDYPDSKVYKEALYNAANNYDLGGKAAEAIALFEQYVARYPTDTRSQGLYFRVAETYSSTMDLPKSIAAYDAVVRLFPTAADAPIALYNASFLRVGQGDHTNAARGYEKYGTTYTNQPDAERVYFRAGAQWELVGDREAEEFYLRYLKRYPSENPNHGIEAAYKLAKTYEKRNDSRRAGAAWAQLRAIFGANASNPALTGQSRSLAAQGALRDLVADYERFKQIKWSTSGSGAEAKNVELLTKTKADERKALEADAIGLIATYQDYDTAAASLYIQGMSLFAFADMAYEIPPPKGLSEEELDIYRATVDKQFRIPAEDAGKARLLSALEKARAEKRWSEWNTKTVIALNERYPSEFPSERQEARGPVQSGAPIVAGPQSVSQPREGE